VSITLKKGSDGILVSSLNRQHVHESSLMADKKAKKNSLFTHFNMSKEELSTELTRLSITHSEGDDHNEVKQ
jgi:hypothetical protein